MNELRNDPCLPWLHRSPYEWISARFVARRVQPVTPKSTMRDVQDALYDVSSPEERTALEELRFLDRRLLVDFLHYQLPVDEPGDFSSLGQWPLPLPEVDWAPLADVPVDPAALDAGPEPAVAALEPEPLTLAIPVSRPALNLGPVEPNYALLLGAEDATR